MCNWAHFRVKATGKEFFLFNSHFDHIGTVARAESAKLLIEKVAEIAGKTPAFCTGDFNSNQQTNVYNTIVTSGTMPVRPIRSTPTGPPTTVTSISPHLRPRLRASTIFS